MTIAGLAHCAGRRFAFLTRKGRSNRQAHRVRTSVPCAPLRGQLRWTSAWWLSRFAGCLSTASRGGVAPAILETSRRRPRSSREDCGRDLFVRIDYPKTTERRRAGRHQAPLRTPALRPEGPRLLYLLFGYENSCRLHDATHRSPGLRFIIFPTVHPGTPPIGYHNPLHWTSSQESPSAVSRPETRAVSPPATAPHTGGPSIRHGAGASPTTHQKHPHSHS